MIHLLSFLFASFDPSDSDALVVGLLGLSLFGFLSYWWAHYSEGIQSWVEAKWVGDRGKIVRVVALKAWGFATMGVIPAWVLHAKWGWTLEDMGVAWPQDVSAEVWGVWTALMISTVVLSMVAGKEGAKNYPQIRATEWSLSTMIWSGLGWTIYLAAYEFMFRGFLLFPMASAIGTWPAVAISTMLYSVTHFHKGKGETLWCLPVGVLTCWMTVETGSLLLTVVGHVLVSWFNTAYHVRRNPNMTWMGWTRG